MLIMGLASAIDENTELGNNGYRPGSMAFAAVILINIQNTHPLQ
jgi:hypothetical protein